MPQVIFVKRHGAYWPGACPELSGEAAESVMEAGLAVPYSDETRAAVKSLLSADIGAESVALPDLRPATPALSALAARDEPPVEEPTEVDVQPPTLPPEEEKPVATPSRAPRRR
jgi:outer membrane biosynthesis protein TonB